MHIASLAPGYQPHALDVALGSTAESDFSIQGFAGHGEAALMAKFNCSGTLGSAGTAGTFGGCIGTAGTAGTFGCGA